MLKRTTLIWLLALVGLAAFAQTDGQGASLRFGYLSYDSVIVSMSEYASMQQSMEQLRAQYAAEQQRIEDDFNKKYEEFLDGQAAFPKTILQKRQSELQEMMERNIAFKHQSQQLLAQAEAEQRQALLQLLGAALKTIGQERGYAFILNTDANATPWLNPAMGDDITDDVKLLLK
jgi:outer membrane protein